MSDKNLKSTQTEQFTDFEGGAGSFEQSFDQQKDGTFEGAFAEQKDGSFGQSFAAQKDGSFAGAFDEKDGFFNSQPFKTEGGDDGFATFKEDK
jgi:hypothetical protein